MAAVSLSDLLQAVGISEQQLNARVSDDHLRRASLFLVSRETLAPFLKLDDSDMEVIEKDGSGEVEKRLRMLLRWRDKNAFNATYRGLVDALLKLGMASHAETVCGLLQSAATSGGCRQPDAVEILHQLREAWSRVPPSAEKRLELLQQMQSLSAELQQSSREEIEALRREIEALRREIENLQIETGARIEALQNDLSTKTTEMDSLRRENETQLKMIAELASVTSEMDTLKGAIEALRTERREQESVISSLRAEIEGMKSEEDRPRKAKVLRLSVHEGAESSECPTATEPTILRWRRANSAPGEVRGGQGVVIGEKVYVRGGYDDCEIYQYDCKRVLWSILPLHDSPVSLFSVAQFLGKLITVGGRDAPDSVTGKVYQFNSQRQRWEEFLPPTPTARYSATVVSRSGSSHKSSAIAVCGGTVGSGKLIDVLKTVEVYSHASSQWHTAEPLPLPFSGLTSTIINDTCYLMGGIRISLYSVPKCCYYVSLDSLINNATISSSRSDDPVWMAVSDTVLQHSTAATVGGSLLAIGGQSGDHPNRTPSPTVHILTSDGSWERVRGGDLPESRSGSTAVCLPSGELMVIGGWREGRPQHTVFIGSLKKQS